MAQVRPYSDQYPGEMNGYDNEQSAGGNIASIIEGDTPQLPEITKEWDGGDVHKQVDPGELQDPQTAQESETPRERTSLRSVAQMSPRSPRQPSPVAMSGAMPGVLPFEPMGDTTDMGMAAPGSQVFGSVRRRNPALFGSLGGLQGGGLGTPFDPTPNEASDPITLLMKLMGGQ